MIVVLSHGLRASEASALNVGDGNRKILTVVQFKGRNGSKVPLSREAQGY
jgi:integrase/recombinase XerD